MSTTLYLVFRDPGPSWVPGLPTRQQPLWDEHAVFMALHHELDPGAPGERYQVVVHVDAPVLADDDAPGQSILENGAHVSAETSPTAGVRREPSPRSPSATDQ